MVRYGTGDGVVLPSIVAFPYLSPTVPCHQRRLATMHIQLGLSNARSQCETTWKNGYECEVYGECMQGDSAGSNPRICLKKNRRIEKFITSYAS